jgi:hypothetical protein
MQALDLTKAVEEAGYAMSRGSIYGNLSSSDDARSRPRWVLNDISSNSSTVPSNDESSNRSGNGFENLFLD